MPTVPNKASGAAGSVTLGGALATLIIALWWPHADATTAVALTTFCNALLAAAGAYFPRMEQGINPPTNTPPPY